MAMSSVSDRRLVVLDDANDSGATSTKMREELRDTELEFINPRGGDATNCSLDVTEQTSCASSLLKNDLPYRAFSPIDEVLLSRCHSQSPDPVDFCWWKPAELLDSWAAPSQSLVSSDCCDFWHSKEPEPFESPTASSNRTITLSSSSGEEGWSPDPAVRTSFSSQSAARKVVDQRQNDHRQGHFRKDEKSNGRYSPPSARRSLQSEEDYRDRGLITTSVSSMNGSLPPLSDIPSTSVQSASSSNNNAAKKFSTARPTREQPTVHAGWKIVENKNRRSLPPQRGNRSLIKDSSPAPDSPNGAFAAWGKTPPPPFKNGDAFVSPPVIGPQAMPPGWNSYSTPASTISRRSSDTRRSSSMMSPYGLDEKMRLLDRAMKDYGGLKYIDTHCHLDLMYNNMHKFDKYSAWRQKYRNTYPATYEGCIPDWCDPCIYDERSNDWWQTVMEGDPTILGTAFGCHPHLSHLYNDVVHQRILYLTKEFPKVVAVGECGFDFSHKNDREREVQQHAFCRQIEIAKETDKVLLIHCRGADESVTEARGDAEDLCFNYVKQGVVKEHTVHRHCFTYGWRVAERWLKEFPNLFIGLTPLIMNAGGERAKVNEVVKNAPLDRLLIETDSPYFMPHFYKSFGVAKGGHPGGGINVALRIAEVRGMEVERVLEQLRDNTRRCYGI